MNGKFWLFINPANLLQHVAEVLNITYFQEIQIGPDHQADVPEGMGPNYEDGKNNLYFSFTELPCLACSTEMFCYFSSNIELINKKEGGGAGGGKVSALKGSGMKGLPGFHYQVVFFP